MKSFSLAWRSVQPLRMLSQVKEEESEAQVDVQVLLWVGEVGCRHRGVRPALGKKLEILREYNEKEPRMIVEMRQS